MLLEKQNIQLTKKCKKNINFCVKMIGFYDKTYHTNDH